MASTDAKPIPIKNSAYRVVFPIFNNTGSLVTGAAGLDSEVSKDQGTFTDCTNEATEIATASGMYYLDLTSTEMNADCVTIIVKTSTTDANTTPIVLYPAETGDIPVNVTAWNGTAVASPATAGIPDVNVKNMNNVAATSITAINANQGTTQPINFTGTGASALAKSDMVDVAGAAVSTSTAQIGVNAVQISGDSVAADNAESFFDGTGYAGTNNVIPLVTTTTTATNLTNAPTAGDFTATMKTSLNAATPAVTVSDKTGFSLSTAGILAIWHQLTSAIVTANTIGKLLVDNIDAAISSRLSTAGYTAPDNTTIGTINTKIGTPSSSVSADIATRAPSATALSTAQWTNTRAGNLDNLDATVSSRLPTSSYVTPPTAASNADAVWDEAIAGHLGAGSTGAALNAAGSAGDPWTTPLPGAYGAGTAGNILGNNLDATVSSRSTLDGTGVQSAMTSQGYTTTRAGYLDTLNGLVAAIWASVTRTLTAGTNIVLAKGTGVTGFNDLSQADVRTATGMASANLDTQLVAIKSDTATSLTNEGTINTNVLTRAPASTAVSNADLTPTRAANLDNLDATVSSRSTLTAANVWAFVIEGALTAQGVMRLILASVANKLSGAATNTISIRDVADTKNRIVATVDVDGNRSAVTLDGS